MNNFLNDDDLVATDDRWFTKSVIPFYGGTLAAVVIVSVVLNWDKIGGGFEVRYQR